MKTYHKDFTGATASITDHRDGTATLRIIIQGKRTVKRYKNRKSAMSAWYRFCN